MAIKKIYKLVRKHYIIGIFAVAGLVALIGTLSRVFVPKPEYVYVKVRMGQGLWWAGTRKPNVWFTTALEKGEKEYNILGKPTSEITEVRYYPYKDSSSDDTFYNIFLTVKLVANVSRKTEIINYRKYSLVVGAPIEFEFPSSQITGTIIDISKEPFKEERVEKIIYIAKRFAYPWEYEGIKIGDKYFDGEEVVFEVLEKTQKEIFLIAPDAFGNMTSSQVEPGRYVVVKAKIKAVKKGDKLVFGEEQLLIPGSPLTVSTSGFDFDGYHIGKVE